jgi:hypothetical protein
MLGFIAVVAIITFAVEMRAHSVRPGLSVFSLSLATALALLSASPTVLVLAVVVGAATGAGPRAGGATGATGARAVGARRARRRRRRRALHAAHAHHRRPRSDRRSLDASEPVGTRAVLRGASAGAGLGWFGSWDVAEQPFATINQLLAQHHSTALNAYVDIQLQLGWAGLLLLCALGGTALVRSWLDASQRRSVVYAWTPLMLIALAVTSAFESVALFGVGWLLLVVCAVRAGQSRGWRERLGAAAPTRPRGSAGAPPQAPSGTGGTVASLPPG